MQYVGSDMPVTHTFKTMTESVSHNYVANPKSLPVESKIMATAKATKTPTRVYVQLFTQLRRTIL